MEPGVIKRLDEVVVNRIAAGEIIQRPANALKEMLENSLDAKSTSIQITVKSGGLKFLQIQDNGTGIRREDLEIVCERFTTSKLQTFDDLSSMKTFGFRGEALASISHVAHLTIQTKTADPTIPCAYRATYADGKLISPPKPCAGNQGTQITVEDLFYNAPQRRQAFKSNAEEFQRINGVVSKYAVHNASVGFCVKKLGENHSFRTQPGGTHRENIALIYGSDVGRELIEIQLTSDEKLQFSVYGFITNINYSTKKHCMLLFINNRLVKSATLKAAIDEVYAMYLPKASHPFVYISLSIDAANVDVNVHPTKHEVHFLYEDEITEEIKLLIERTLLGSNDSRKYYSQTRLPGASDPSFKNDSQSADVSMSQTVYAKDLVRSDSKIQKLEKFFGDVVLLQSSQSQSNMSLVDETIDGDREEMIKKTFTASTPVTTPINQLTRTKKSNTVTRKKTELSSILKMRKQVEEDCSLSLRNILSDLIFVGCVNEKQTLIQHETMLYLCDNQKLGDELFYQILLYDFENFGEIKFEEPGLPIRELIILALESDDSGWTPEDGPIEDLATTVCDILVKKAIILQEYYSFLVSEDGFLLQLPLLLENHKPSLAHLPMYLLRLATEVDWESEQDFFQTFSRETASFYSIISGEPDSNGSGAINGSSWFIEHVLYAALKDKLLPPQDFTHNNSFLQVASLSNLYKVFERC